MQYFCFAGNTSRRRMDRNRTEMYETSSSHWHNKFPECNSRLKWKALVLDQAFIREEEKSQQRDSLAGSDELFKLN